MTAPERGAGAERCPRGDGGLESLERALSFLRGRLADIGDEHLGAPTPCSRWDLHDLLVHLDDVLDTLVEAGAGSIHLVAAEPVGTTAPRVATLQHKVGELLGTWTSPVVDHGRVAVGDTPLDRVVLAHAGALEVAVHAWDVGVATGHPAPLPETLARALLPFADLLVDDVERGDPRTGRHRFGPAPITGGWASYGDRLLAVTGRRAAPTRLES